MEFLHKYINKTKDGYLDFGINDDKDKITSDLLLLSNQIHWLASVYYVNVTFIPLEELIELMVLYKIVIYKLHQVYDKNNEYGDWIKWRFSSDIINILWPGIAEWRWNDDEEENGELYEELWNNFLQKNNLWSHIQDDDFDVFLITTKDIFWKYLSFYSKNQKSKIHKQSFARDFLSVFTNEYSSYLETNDEKFISSGSIYSLIQEQVYENKNFQDYIKYWELSSPFYFKS